MGSFLISDSMRQIAGRFIDIVKAVDAETSLLMAAVYGSQLCGLDEEGSDVDVLAIEKPDVESLLRGSDGAGLRLIGGDHVNIISATEFFRYVSNAEAWVIQPFTTAHSARCFADCCSAVQLNIGTAFDASASTLRYALIKDLAAKMKGDILRAKSPNPHNPEAFREFGYEPKTAASAYKQFLLAEAVLSGEGESLGDLAYLKSNPDIGPYFDMRHGSKSPAEAVAFLAEKAAELDNDLLGLPLEGDASSLKSAIAAAVLESLRQKC